jgi:hypothetical protein
VTSEPLPTALDGIPLPLRVVNVTIDRPVFMFNPTNCKAQQIAASISGDGLATVNVISPFTAGGCKSLGFIPRFSVSTSARTSRARGASLDAKVSIRRTPWVMRLISLRLRSLYINSGHQH